MWKVTVLVLCLTACEARAAGINLSWNECGVTGSETQGDLCTSNAGVVTLVGSFMPPELPELLGLTAKITVRNTGPALVDWWRHGPNNCRGAAALSTSFDFTTSDACADYSFGQAVGACSATTSADASSLTITIVSAVPFDNRTQVTDTLEYYAFRLRVHRSKSTGIDQCVGCLIPASVTLEHIALYQPAALANDPILAAPVDRAVAYWQAELPGATVTPTTKLTLGTLKRRFR